MENLENLELLTPTDAAKRLGFSTAHVLKLCRAGELPAARVGNRWRVIWPLALKKILEQGGNEHVETHY